MISNNDTSIISVLTRYPNMPIEEAEKYISKLQHEENIPICRAIIGQLQPEELDNVSYTIYEQLMNWSKQRTSQIRSEQIHARRNNRATKLAERLKSLKERGVIDEKVLLLYGISGDLPHVETYQVLSDEEKNRLWERRIEARYGENWRQIFPDTTFISTRKVNISQPVNWKKEGF